MSTYNLVHLGEIDPTNLEEYYDGELTFNGHSIEVDINFDKTSISVDKLGKINEWLSDVQKIDTLGKAAIQYDLTAGDTVNMYIEHHLGELDPEYKKTMFKKATTGITDEEKMLSLLRIKRIGFYPHEDNGRFVTVDYSIDPEWTDYLVVLDFTENWELFYITMES